MDERISVFVEGKKISLLRGLQVKHALIAYDQNIYEEAMAGKIRVTDRSGFEVGLEGGLTDGCSLFLKKSG